MGLDLQFPQKAIMPRSKNRNTACRWIELWQRFLSILVFAGLLKAAVKDAKPLFYNLLKFYTLFTDKMTT